MKIYQQKCLWVKDVMRTLSHNYWTNVFLQNVHFLTPFLTLFRQIFSDFWIFFCKLTPFNFDFRLRPVFTRLEVQKKVEQNPRVCWQYLTPENVCNSPILSIWSTFGQLLIWAKTPILSPFSSPSRHVNWCAHLKVFKAPHHFCNFWRMNSHKRIIALWFLFDDDVMNAICDVIYAADDVIPPPILT